MSELAGKQLRATMKTDRRNLVNAIKIATYNTERLLTRCFFRHYADPRDWLRMFRAILHLPGLIACVMAPFDEPLSNLDAKLRVEMRQELRELFERLKLTALYVTHDQEEALVLSHRIAVMHGGRVVQLGPPMEIYKEPANLFVAGFVGTTNLLEGRIARRVTVSRVGSA